MNKDCTKIEILENKIEYIENLRSKQIASLKDSITRKLNNDIELELKSLEDIAYVLPELRKQQVIKHINRIRKYLGK